MLAAAAGPGEGGDQPQLRVELCTSRRSASVLYSVASVPRRSFAVAPSSGEHGSWNRPERNGYKVVFIRFENGKPVGPPIDFVTDFLKGDSARGRPVGVAIDKAACADRCRRCRQYRLARHAQRGELTCRPARV